MLTLPLLGFAVFFTAAATIALRVNILLVGLVGLSMIAFAVTLGLGPHVLDPIVSWAWGFGWALVMMVLGWALGVCDGLVYERSQANG